MKVFVCRQGMWFLTSELKFPVFLNQINTALLALLGNKISRLWISLKWWGVPSRWHARNIISRLHLSSNNEWHSWVTFRNATQTEGTTVASCQALKDTPRCVYLARGISLTDLPQILVTFIEFGEFCISVSVSKMMIYRGLLTCFEWFF